MRASRTGWIGWACALALLALGVLGTVEAQVLRREVRDRILAATVLVVALDAQGKPVSHGSGTLISPLGHIITNYHVVGDTANRRIAPSILVGTIRFEDQPPELRFQAEVVAADPNLDLALLRIVRTVEGRPIGNVTFPAVPIGDSHRLAVGDPIYAAGFPGTGGVTVTLVSGLVGGFVGEDFESGGKQWVKYDALIGPGHSGGGVFNQEGELVGVSTLVLVDPQTASRTAYMRPSALVWGLVGPNVPVLADRPSGGGGSPPPSLPTSPPSPPTVAGAGWPPVIREGQSWWARLQGGQWTGDWLVAVRGKDADGDFEVTATQGGRREGGYFILRDSDLLLVIGTRLPVAVCLFKPQEGGGAIRGQLLEGRQLDSKLEEVGTCVLSPASQGVGGGEVSRAGVVWTVRNPPTPSLRDVIYARGQFVAVGEGSTVLTSSDGVGWTRRNSGTDRNLLYGVAYGNGQFVAVGNWGIILTSP